MLLSPLSQGVGAWSGSYSFQDPIVEFPVIHRHGMTISSQDDSDTVPFVQNEKGLLLLPKTYFTRKGAPLLYSVPNENLFLAQPEVARSIEVVESEEEVYFNQQDLSSPKRILDSIGFDNEYQIQHFTLPERVPDSCYRVSKKYQPQMKSKDSKENISARIKYLDKVIYNIQKEGPSTKTEDKVGPPLSDMFMPTLDVDGKSKVPYLSNSQNDLFLDNEMPLLDTSLQDFPFEKQFTPDQSLKGHFNRRKKVLPFRLRGRLTSRTSLIDPHIKLEAGVLPLLTSKPECISVKPETNLSQKVKVTTSEDRLDEFLPDIHTDLYEYSFDTPIGIRQSKLKSKAKRFHLAPPSFKKGDPSLLANKFQKKETSIKKPIFRMSVVHLKPQMAGEKNMQSLSKELDLHEVSDQSLDYKKYDSEKAMAEPTLEFDSEKDMAEPTLEFDSGKDMVEPTLEFDSEKDMAEPTLEFDSEKDMAEPTLEFDSEKDMAEPTLEFVSEKAMAEPTLEFDSEKAMAESTLEFDSEKAMAEPTLEFDSRKAMVEPTLEFDSRKAMVEPTLEFDSRKAMVEPKLEFDSRKAMVEPTLEFDSRKAMVEPTLEFDSRKAMVEPTLEFDSEKAMVEPTLEFDSEKAMVEPTLEFDSEKAMVEPTLEFDSEKAMVEPTLEFDSGKAMVEPMLEFDSEKAMVESKKEMDLLHIMAESVDEKESNAPKTATSLQKEGSGLSEISDLSSAILFGFTVESPDSSKDTYEDGFVSKTASETDYEKEIEEKAMFFERRQSAPPGLIMPFPKIEELSLLKTRGLSCKNKMKVTLGQEGRFSKQILSTDNLVANLQTISEAERRPLLDDSFENISEVEESIEEDFSKLSDDDLTPVKELGSPIQKPSHIKKKTFSKFYISEADTLDISLLQKGSREMWDQNRSIYEKNEMEMSLDELDKETRDESQPEEFDTLADTKPVGVDKETRDVRQPEEFDTLADTKPVGVGKKTRDVRQPEEFDTLADTKPVAIDKEIKDESQPKEFDALAVEAEKQKDSGAKYVSHIQQLDGKTDETGVAKITSGPVERPLPGKLTGVDKTIEKFKKLLKDNLLLSDKTERKHSDKSIKRVVDFGDHDEDEGFVKHKKTVKTREEKSALPVSQRKIIGEKPLEERELAESEIQDMAKEEVMDQIVKAEEKVSEPKTLVLTPIATSAPGIEIEDIKIDQEFPQTQQKTEQKKSWPRQLKNEMDIMRKDIAKKRLLDTQNQLLKAFESELIHTIDEIEAEFEVFKAKKLKTIDDWLAELEAQEVIDETESKTVQKKRSRENLMKKMFLRKLEVRKKAEDRWNKKREELMKQQLDHLIELEELGDTIREMTFEDTLQAEEMKKLLQYLQKLKLTLQDTRKSRDFELNEEEIAALKREEVKRILEELDNQQKLKEEERERELMERRRQEVRERLEQEKEEEEAERLRQLELQELKEQEIQRHYEEYLIYLKEKEKRDWNLAESKELGQNQYFQNLTRPWVFSYYLLWPLEASKAPFHDAVKKKRKGAKKGKK